MWVTPLCVGPISRVWGSTLISPDKRVGVRVSVESVFLALLLLTLPFLEESFVLKLTAHDIIYGAFVFQKNNGKWTPHVAIDGLNPSHVRLKVWLSKCFL